MTKVLSLVFKFKMKLMKQKQNGSGHMDTKPSLVLEGLLIAGYQRVS